MYLFSTPGLVPPALLANVRHNNVLHRQVIVLSIETALRPRVHPAERSTVTQVGAGVHQVVLRYGFVEDPDVPTGLGQGRAARLGIDPQVASYFLGAESITPSPAPGWPSGGSTSSSS